MVIYYIKIIEYLKEALFILDNCRDHNVRMSDLKRLYRVHVFKIHLKFFCQILYLGLID